MKNEIGQDVIQYKCKGKHVDDECKMMKCKKAEYHCIIQELKRIKKGKEVK